MSTGALWAASFGTRRLRGRPAVEPHAAGRFDGGAAQVVMTLAVTPLGPEVDRLTPRDRQRLVDAVAQRAGDGPIDSTLRANTALAYP